MWGIEKVVKTLSLALTADSVAATKQKTSENFEPRGLEFGTFSRMGG
jgi:hypothetical protein